MIFDNIFRDLDAPTAAALLSCFICQEKGNTPKLADALSGCLRIHSSSPHQAPVVAVTI